MGDPTSTDLAPSVHIVTLGCGRNEVDTDQLAGLLSAGGHRVSGTAEDADVVLINTCTFIGPAKQESIDTILAACELKETGSAKAVLVVGCMAQRYPQELADEIPEADAIVGFDGYTQLPDLVTRAFAKDPNLPRVVVGPAHPGSRPADRDPAAIDPLAATPATTSTKLRRDLPLMMVAPAPPEAPPVVVAPTVQDELDRIPLSGPRFPVRRFDGRPWAYLKIASGCDRVCTFCAIPGFRGRFRSRPVDELLAEASWLAEQGAKELVLVSENTTSYGKDLGGRDQAVRLLEQLGEVDGLDMVRLMYLQPAELQRPLVEAIATMPHVASYFDLSLQHASAPVIQRMARSGSHEKFLKIISDIRDLDPLAAFRSNFIVGFPGETEEDVDVLEQFLVDARIDWVGMFPFSVEDGTPSATFPDQVDEDLAHERLERLTQTQELLSEQHAATYVGRTLEVIVQETISDDGTDAVCLARSYREAPDTDGDITLVDGDGNPVDLPPGRRLDALVVDNFGVDLIAQVG